MISADALRPAWTPVTIAMMVIGFMIFWPLGLAMVAYIVWGDRVPEIRRHFGDMSGHRSRGHRCGPRMRSKSGNMAFDDYRQRELTRLEEERRKLDEELQEFEQFMSDLRRARDQEEFDRYRDKRSTHDGSTIEL
jgi:hypothetical protein